MSLIVDASVAVKWYLPERNSLEAEQILSTETDLIAPEIVIAEVGNAVWKRLQKAEVSLELAGDIIERATTAFSLLVPLRDLARQAMLLAVRHRHSIYDCFYVALAQQAVAPLATADAKLAVLATQIGIEVELLG